MIKELRRNTHPKMVVLLNWKVRKTFTFLTWSPRCRQSHLKLKKYWFPRLRNYVKRFVGACIECIYHKQPAERKQGFLHPFDKIGVPFHTIHVDHLGLLVKCKYVNMYIFVLIDGFAKFCILKPVRHVRSETTVRTLNEIISIFGGPNRIISGRGRFYR